MTDDDPLIHADLTAWPATLLPIEARLDLLQRDFPELVRIAKNTLADPRYSRQQAVDSVHAMIRAEASWQRAQHTRRNLDWVARQLLELGKKQTRRPQ